MADISLVHTHIHSRRTGVTSSIENVLPGLAEKYNTYWYGNNLNTSVKKIKTYQLYRLLKNNKKLNLKTIVHAHRNIEIIKILFLRLFVSNFYMVVTRHSSTKPSWLTRYLFAKANKVIVLNEIAKKYFSDSVDVVPHGLDVDKYPLNRQVSNTIGIPDKHIIGIVGRVRELKGQKDLVKATVQLLKNYPNWDVLILGQVKPQDQIYVDSIKEIIRENGLQDRYHFPGETPDPRQYYNVMDIVVVASYTEGSSMVPLEAMASGCVVIATSNVGTNSMLINHGVNGLLYQKGDIEELELNLEKLIEDENLLKELKLASRKSVEIDWSVSSEINHLSKIYKNLIDDK